MIPKESPSVRSYSIAEARSDADFSALLQSSVLRGKCRCSDVSQLLLEKSKAKRECGVMISLGSPHMQRDYMVILFDAIICLISFKR